MSIEELVTYHDGPVELTGRLYRPKGPARGAILVFPTILNPTKAVTDKAQSLADDGYLALVADFYGKTPESFDQSREFALEIRETPELYRKRLRSSLKALALHDAAQGLPLGAIGFCMGGQAVLELAREGAPLFAAVSFHGILGTEMPAEAGKIRAKILICHGDGDPMVPRREVLKFWEEMDEAGGDWHFHSYSGVKHGFTNPEPTGNPATGYDASADAQSWASMHSLFDEILALCDETLA